MALSSMSISLTGGQMRFMRITGQVASHSAPVPQMMMSDIESFPRGVIVRPCGARPQAGVSSTLRSGSDNRSPVRVGHSGDKRSRSGNSYALASYFGGRTAFRDLGVDISCDTSTNHDKLLLCGDN